MNLQREQLENDRKCLNKELSDLITKLDDPTPDGFTLDSTPSKSTNKLVKKEIISMDSESSSETSNNNEDDSESECTDILPKGKNIGIGKKTSDITTTKGSSKNLKLNKIITPKSDDESD